MSNVDKIKKFTDLLLSLRKYNFVEQKEQIEKEIILMFTKEVKEEDANEYTHVMNHKKNNIINNANSIFSNKEIQDEVLKVLKNINKERKVYR